MKNIRSHKPGQCRPYGTISPMLRRVTYRTAANAFVFASLWFLIGIFLLWTPAPSALDIRGQFFIVWLLLFFVILGGAGGALILASFNSAFPPANRRRRFAATGRQPPLNAAEARLAQARPDERPSGRARPHGSGTARSG